jgi:exonuclease I
LQWQLWHAHLLGHRAHQLLLELDIDELKKLMFTKQAELPEGVERLQIKDLIFNKSPIFIPNVYKLEVFCVVRSIVF